MTRYLLDTNIPSELTRTKVNRHVEEWLRNANQEALYLSAISLGEIRKGTASLADGARRRVGKPLSMADGLIAATALEHDLTVVTRNEKDFTGLGVELINPWEPD